MGTNYHPPLNLERTVEKDKWVTKEPFYQAHSKYSHTIPSYKWVTKEPFYHATLPCHTTMPHYHATLPCTSVHTRASPSSQPPCQGICIHMEAVEAPYHALCLAGLLTTHLPSYQAEPEPEP